ncbi:protein of unknown function [Pseudorhizobium banfieldiae]|uniref:Uncharacterized protein n=1 Tax=Pseudorhizobium banfieldiae TaxID=1125847 RepID=L0NDM7_9HYPH|nr:hypothetical protein RNT25_01800 [arsenite-oxidising bacterium NT-25]CCF19145.1 protein of unknown function [Pseudorhizobium banfieldiae]
MKPRRRTIRVEPIVRPRMSDLLDSGFVWSVAIVALILAMWVAAYRWAEYLRVLEAAARV